MKVFVVEIGWPTSSKVGEKASLAAVLIIRHADQDLSFQMQCLTLMKEFPPEEVSPQDIAHLEDRICVNMGKPQIYGTQFTQIKGKHVPRPILDPDNVDARRRAMGLDTFEENIKRMYEKYPFPQKRPWISRLFNTC